MTITRRYFGLTCALMLGATLLTAQAPKGGPKGPQTPGMTLRSPAFEDGGNIPQKFGMSDPKPVSPKLVWANVPANVVSFALIFHDPDGAPRGRVEDYLHWMLFNVPATTRELPEAVPTVPQLPDGSIQPKSRGVNGYIGPGAPSIGPYHHYTFELFALDIKLELGPDATRPDMLKAMDGHILDKAVLVGHFIRQ